jgi:uncharacterized protein (DUF2062 family)
MSKIVDAFKSQLVQGSSPKGLALTCAIGSSLAVFPLLGTTTFLCLMVGVVWKLNQPILQAVNYVLYPVQIILLPLFLAAGATLTHSDPISFNPSTITKEFMAHPKIFLATYGMAGLHAILVWVIVAPVLAWLVYQISLRVFSKWRTES